MFSHREVMETLAHKDMLDRRETLARGEHLVAQDAPEKM